MREGKSIFGDRGRIATAVNRSLVRNDRVFARSAVQGWAGRPGGRPLQRHSPIELRRGRCPHRPASVTRGAEERAGENPAPTEDKKFVGADDSVHPPPITQHLVGQGPCALPSAEKTCRADVGSGPYGSATRSAMGGRPQGSPLRRVTSSTGNGPMWASAPTEGFCGATNIFLFSCKFILEKQLGICYTLHYSGNKFLSA